MPRETIKDMLKVQEEQLLATVKSMINAIK